MQTHADTMYPQNDRSPSCMTMTYRHLVCSWSHAPLLRGRPVNSLYSAPVIIRQSRSGRLPICACHPLAGAMRIFSASFNGWSPKGIQDWGVFRTPVAPPRRRRRARAPPGAPLAPAAPPWSRPPAQPARRHRAGVFGGRQGDRRTQHAPGYAHVAACRRTRLLHLRGVAPRPEDNYNVIDIDCACYMLIVSCVSWFRG